MLRALACIAALLVALPLAAATKVLRHASQFDPGSMDPHAIASLYNNRVVSQIYEPLVGRDEQFRPEPRLALSWTALEGKGWRFVLRPGVKFHDGTPFTADDVVFNIERAMSATSAYRSALPAVTGARKVDALTVDILTSQPAPSLPLALTNLRFMSKAWCEKHNATKPQDYKAREETYAARNANGTGPYRLVKWDTDVKTLLAAAPGYWGKRGNVEEAQFLVVGSAATRVSGLLSGEIDVVIDPAAQDLERLRTASGVTLATGVGTSTQYIGFDHGRDTLRYGKSPDGRNPFRDRRVREAVRAAIDMGAIRDKVLRGTFVMGRSMFSPVVDGYDAKLGKPAPFDPARAKALLAAAGYAQGFDVALDCSSQQPADSICQSVSAMLARVGIRVDYRPLAFNQLLPKLTQGDTSFYAIGWTPATAEAEGVLLPLVHAPGAAGVGEYNFGKYFNAKVDALIDRARVEFDPAKRRALFIEAMEVLDEDVAYVTIGYRAVNWAMRRNVKAAARANDILDLRFVTIE